MREAFSPEIMERNVEFSQSRLWDWQKEYYSQEGIATWQDGRTPHYITSNARIARNYAEMALAFLEDLSEKKTHNAKEPIYIVELGAGSGRFSFHFLYWLQKGLQEANLPLDSFKYIISDVAQANLDFCLQHPNFQKYLDSQILEVARIDLLKPESIFLQKSQKEIKTGTLGNPMVVIANYLFDSLPNHLFQIENNNAYLGYITLTKKEKEAAKEEEGIGNYEKSLAFRRLVKPLFMDPIRNELVEDYIKNLDNSFVLLPTSAMDALDHFNTYSNAGMLLLTADKGNPSLADWEGNALPNLTEHGGAFSVMVNYHALGAHCNAKQGLALFPDSLHYYIAVGCLLYAPNSNSYKRLKKAYQQQINHFGPDAFEGMVSELRERKRPYSFRSILAYLQLSYYDSYVLDTFFNELYQGAAKYKSYEQEQLIEVLDLVWELYYPIGESHCPASQIASILYEMDEYASALSYYEKSIAINGPNTAFYFNMALCLLGLDKKESAKHLLLKVVEHDPNNAQASELLQKMETTDLQF